MYAAGFRCAACGEWIETTVDESGGSKQQHVEDCQVCCQPNVLTVRCVGAGVYDYIRAGELDVVEMPLHPGFVQNRTKLNSCGLDAGWSDLNHGANSLTAGRSHIIRTSLDVLAERHF
ncbi:MAG TPA: CPXCG motif-containing cysteine-rich protein [Edaphobacter sp.]|nr:CPXCG motif-containing cysteine-rich protein [Edaphobacter sp.]